MVMLLLKRKHALDNNLIHLNGKMMSHVQYIFVNEYQTDYIAALIIEQPASGARDQTY